MHLILGQIGGFSMSVSGIVFLKYVQHRCGASIVKVRGCAPDFDQSGGVKGKTLSGL